MGVGPAFFGGQEVLEREGHAGEGANIFPAGKTLFQLSRGPFRFFEFRVDERVQIAVSVGDPLFKIPDHFRGGNVSGIDFSADLGSREIF